ncbi:uncharacterized protein LOC120291439 [Eucalyptus grandis]|uniref:uncharacterized protein LOC120291439 n=1 Tax=Eucalyptus grandis TaxID=71139 RepID=UPI00192EBB09|nr:uncharacterized protein LOC120291439 [Eucalyptus grandis]
MLAQVLSQVEFSKPANTEHSSIQGVKRKHKEKDDGKAFPNDDEDEDEDKITERKNNKTAKCIALEVSHEPTLPLKVRTNSSKSHESITETVGASSNLQSSPSVGGSSTTWARANVKLLTSSFLFRLTLSMLILYFFLAVTSKFNRQLIFRTKPIHSFPYKSDLFDVKPDKDSSLPVDLTGTDTTGISPTTEQGDMPFDRASTIPSLATIVPALPPPAARPKPSSATDEDRTSINAEADLYGDDEESLFLKIESLLSGDTGKQNTGAGMSRSSQSDLQAYQKASQEVENIMSQGLLAIMFNPKLLGHLQELLNFLVEHETPEVSTFGHVYLKLQHFIQSAGDSLSSQRKILTECERFEREFKKENNFLEYDKDEVLLLKQQIEETAKSVADNEQFIAKLQAEIEARKLRLENAKSELSSLLTKRSEKVKELKTMFKRVLSMKSENPSMEKKRNQAEETIGKINVEWNELHANIKGRLASK